MPRPITRTSASGSHDDDECPNPPPMPSTMADAIAALVNATAENDRLLRELAQNHRHHTLTVAVVIMEMMSQPMWILLTPVRLCSLRQKNL